jgi:hypothetical protein
LYGNSHARPRPDGDLGRQRLCDALLEASIPERFKDASRSLAVGLDGRGVLLPARQGRPLRRPGALYQPYESVWNRAGLDSAVSIHSVERFLGDLALERDGQMTTTPARIASSYSNT